jgi:hypothetical protein
MATPGAMILRPGGGFALDSTSAKTLLVESGGTCCGCSEEDEPIIPSGSDCNMRDITLTEGDDGPWTGDGCDGTVDLATTIDKNSMSHGDTVTLTCVFTNNTDCDPIDWSSDFGFSDGEISDTAFMVLTAYSSNWDSTGTLAASATITFWATWTYDATQLTASDLTASPDCCNATTAFVVAFAGQDKRGPFFEFCGVDATP